MGGTLLALDHMIWGVHGRELPPSWTSARGGHALPSLCERTWFPAFDSHRSSAGSLPSWHRLRAPARDELSRQRFGMRSFISLLAPVYALPHEISYRACASVRASVRAPARDELSRLHFGTRFVISLLAPVPALSHEISYVACASVRDFVISPLALVFAFPYEISSVACASVRDSFLATWIPASECFRRCDHHN